MCFFFFFQAEDGIRDLVRSRGLGDVYKRQTDLFGVNCLRLCRGVRGFPLTKACLGTLGAGGVGCLLYTSDAADERSSVDLGGRRII